MLTMLKNWKGTVEIDGVPYENMKSVTPCYKPRNNHIHIKLHSKSQDGETTEGKRVKTEDASTKKVYKFKVKQYMTQKATPEFDFMEKWNNNEPMPLRVMVGTIEKETPGMYYITAHGDILQERTLVCMKCGKKITNPVSQYFGLGPECGRHGYVNPFSSDEALKQAVAGYRKQLQSKTWTGWVIKKAIEEMEEIEQDI
jgi:hypothetical protein